MPGNRRSFLKGAGAAAAVVSAVPLGVTLREDGPSPGVLAAPNPRAVAAGHFALELDGPDGPSMDLLLSYAGGFPFGRVVEFRKGGEGGPPNKRIGGVGVEDIVVQVGADLSPALRAWVAEMVSGGAGAHSKKDGAILFLDFNYNLQSRLTFSGALISGVAFPACDAASKDVAALTIVISPEMSEFGPSSGKFAPSATKQKKWLVSNFRVTVGDLPTNRVVKIDEIVVKQAMIEFSDATSRFPQKMPGKLELPDLVLSFSSSDGAPWFDYFKTFVLGGAGDEKQGSLEYLAPDLVDVLLKVDFHNLGIFKCQLEQAESASSNIARTTAAMYMEGVSLPAVQ